MKIRILVPLLMLCLGSTSLHAQLRTGTGAVKELYDTYCATCHGQDMSGGMGSSLIDEEWAHGSSDEEIAKVIRDGIPGTGMVAWKSMLDDNQIRSLVIYIHEQKLIAQSQALLKRLEPKNGVYKSALHNFKLEEVGEGSAALWGMDFMPDGGVLVSQIDGKLWIFKDGNRQGPIEGPKVWNNGQGGLLDVALHPDYADNGWIYLAYSKGYGKNADGNETAIAVIVRGRIQDGRWVDQESIFDVPAKLVTDLSTIYEFGARILFKDGYVYFSIGDRHVPQTAQDMKRPNGKIHRLHDDGRIPADNPFVNQKDALPSIWSVGNRNAQGMAFHPVTGELWETEHGPRGGDELNLIEPGKNYGWPTITYGMNYDGTPITDKTEQAGLEQPVHYWVPSIAVSTLAFYTGDKFPAWRNQAFTGGLASQEIHRLALSGGKVTMDEIILKDQGRVRDLGVSPDGYIYVIFNTTNPSSRTGKLYRMVPAGK